MLPKEPHISYDTLRMLLEYDVEVAELRWIVSRGPNAAGKVVEDDYVKILGRTYVTARVIWCLYYKEWPPLDKLVDHKNRIKADNRIENMRLATYAQNSHNQGGRGMLPKGIYIRNRASPYAARIMVNGKSIELGSFPTLEEAVEAYRQGAIKYHGEFACLK